MNTSSIWKSFLGFCTVLLMTAPLHAQYKSRQQAADEAFQSALVFAAEGNFAAACPLLQRVQELDPTEGAIFALADCRDHEGRIATALRLWRTFVDTYGADNGTAPDKRRSRLETARKRIHELETAVPKIKFTSRSSESREVKVFVGGAQIHIDEALELDPGEHRVIIARARAKREVRVIKLEREKPLVEVNIDVVDSASEWEGNPINPVVDKGKASEVSMTPDDSMRAASVSRNRAFGIAAVTIGGAGIVAAGVLGAVALANKATADAECTTSSSGTICTRMGLDAVNEGRTIGDVATIPLVLGAACISVGAVFIARNPKIKATAGLTFTNGGSPVVSVQGSF